MELFIYKIVYHNYIIGKCYAIIAGDLINSIINDHGGAKKHQKQVSILIY